MQAASNPKRHAVRRTSDFFAETLNALSVLNTSSHNCEQASTYSVNVMMDDEQSFTTTGYEEHVKY